jgi:hypothetical protein
LHSDLYQSTNVVVIGVKYKKKDIIIEIKTINKATKFGLINIFFYTPTASRNLFSADKIIFKIKIC